MVREPGGGLEDYPDYSGYSEKKGRKERPTANSQDVLYCQLKRGMTKACCWFVFSSKARTVPLEDGGSDLRPLPRSACYRRESE